TRRKRVNIFLIGLGLVLMVVGIFLDFLRGKPEFTIGFLQQGLIAIGVILASIAFGWYHWPATWHYARKVGYWVAVGAFVIGIALILVNVYGLFVGLRNPAVYEPKFKYGGVVRKVEYTEREIFELIDRQDGESEEAYARRVTQLVFDGVVHHWPYDNFDEFNIHPPVYENFIIWALGFKLYDYMSYQYCDPYRAIERGVGVCSQVTMIITQLMERNGIETHLLDLKGHVVAEVLVDPETDTWWIVDADFGVLIEHDLETAQKNLDLVEQAYFDAGYKPGSAVEDVFTTFGKDYNFIVDIVPECKTEELLYRLKWIIPAALILPYGTVFALRSRRKE
ncbi:hypothetical protein ACFLYP_04565, partial [Chloroflexota bacterium]